MGAEHKTYLEILIDGQAKARQECADRWLADNKDINAAFNFSLDALACVVSRHSLVSQETLLKRMPEKRLPLICSYIQGAWVIKQLVVEGLLTQAAPLIRQQLVVQTKQKDPFCFQD